MHTAVSVVEALLKRLHDGSELQVEDPMQRLREFDGFMTVCSDRGGDANLSMVLAPDVGGRRLLAAFTAQDSLQNFVVASSGACDVELVSARLSGQELFEQISSGGLDGVVFNPSGPSAPIPLSCEAAQAILHG